MNIKKIYVVHVLLIISLIGFSGCKIGGDGNNNTGITLKITAISPGDVLSHTAFLLVVTGQGFNRQSVIVFDNKEVETQWVSSNKISAEITADLTVFSLDQPQTEIPVYVIDKNPGTGSSTAESNHLSLTIKHLPEFSEPEAIYQVPAEVVGISHLQLTIDENNTFFLLWRESSYRDDFVPVFESKLGVSRDGGQTWEPSLKLPATQSLFSWKRDLFLFPNDDAMEDGNLKFYLSGNNGTTWETRLIDELNKEQTFCGYQVSMDKSGIFILVYGQIDNFGQVHLTILQSSNQGNTWEKNGEHESPFDPSGDGYVYGYHLDWMVTNQYGGIVFGALYDSIIPVAISRVYKSSNRGAALEESSGGLARRNLLYFENGILRPDGTLLALYCDNDYYRVYELTFFRGDDLGTNDGLFHVLDKYYSSGDMVVDKDGNIYIAWSIYVSRSISDGDQWTVPLELAAETFGKNTVALDVYRNLFIVRNSDEKEIILIHSSLPGN